MTTRTCGASVLAQRCSVRVISGGGHGREVDTTQAGSPELRHGPLASDGEVGQVGLEPTT
ncbi:hypothetical protein [Actinomycetospora sp. CA-084318]|uniref:hypothetical protein n=1 Tax=Actinomycetospora sp. CA-084318 TaxID=3239892 RepID=UPI003D98D0A7